MSTIKLDPAQRHATVVGSKTRHLVGKGRSDEPPYSAGDVLALWRAIPDPTARDENGKLCNLNRDGTPKTPAPEAHVEIVRVVETPLRDLVKADAQAMGFERLTDMARWWMDLRSPSWRNAYGEGDYIAGDEVLKQFRSRWHHRTAWLVVWNRTALDPTVWLSDSPFGGTTTNPARALRDAGTCIPQTMQDALAKKSFDDALATEAEAKLQRVRDGLKLADQFERVFTAPGSSYAETRAGRKAARFIRHQMNNGIAKLEARLEVEA